MVVGNWDNTTRRCSRYLGKLGGGPTFQVCKTCNLSSAKVFIGDREGDCGGSKVAAILAIYHQRKKRKVLDEVRKKMKRNSYRRFYLSLVRGISFLVRAGGSF